MDSSGVTSIIAIALLLLLSAYFSATETAFSSLNKVRLKNMVKNNVRGAKRAYDMSEEFDKILSTILIGNNIVNIVSASLSTLLFTKWVGEANGVAASTLVMTILVLIFGEISPKSLAKENPEKFAIFSAPILHIFSVIIAPLNYPFTLWKKLLTVLFKFENDSRVSEEELITMVEEAEQDGDLSEHESKLIRSAIEFNDCDAVEILTSRPDIVAIPKSMPMLKVKETFAEHGFSRMPVYEDNIDQIIGVIHEKDFYPILFDGATDFSSIIKPIHGDTPKTKISELLQKLQQTKSHMAIIVDEFGSTMGIVTVEDILEELVGEIWDEHDEVILDFAVLSDHKYSVLCSANLDDFFEFFNITNKFEKYEDVQTVSGLVIEEIGHIPNIGDKFNFENLTIEVTKTDYRRIVEIEVEVDPHYIKPQNDDEKHS